MSYIVRLKVSCVFFPHLNFTNDCIALRQIHEAGWVHRDISPGNLYLYTNPVTGESRGLIGDFEFAKRVGTGGGMCDNRVVRTTSQINRLFMAHII